MNKKNRWIAEILGAAVLFYATDKSLPALILLFGVGAANAVSAAVELFGRCRR